MPTDELRAHPEDTVGVDLSTPHEPPRPRWLRRGLAIAFVAYLVTYLALPRDGFWINDNECKFIQLQGMLRTHYRDFSISWSGQELNPDWSFNPLIDPFGYIFNDRLYCFSPPAFALVSSLPYRLWGYDGLYILPIAAGLLTLPAVWCLAGFLPTPRLGQPIALFLVALGTPMWFYSMTFWEHTPATCLATWSIVFCMRHVLGGGARRAAMSGVLCGLATYFRDDLYILGIVLAAVLLVLGRERRRSSALSFAIGFAVTLVPLWWFQWMALGHPLGHHSLHHSPLEFGYLRYCVERWPVVRSLLINCHSRFLLSALVSAPYLVLWVVYPRVSQRVFRWIVPLLAAVAAVGGLVTLVGHVTAYSPVWWLLGANSLFSVSPVLVLAFIRKGDASARNDQAGQQDNEARAQRALWLILSLYVSAFVLVVPKLHATGIHWGGRLLLSAYPLLGVMASSTIACWWKAREGRTPARNVLLGVAIGLSIGAQAYSLHLLSLRKAFSARLNHVVAGRPESVVVTAHAAIPQYLSRSFYDKTIFLLRSREDWNRLNSILRRAGQRNVLLVNAWRPRPDAILRTGGTLQDGASKYIAVQLQSRTLPRMVEQ